MGKLIKLGVVGLAIYGGYVLLDKHARRYLRSHRREVMDKLDYLLFGPDEEKPTYRSYTDYARHAKVTN